MKSDSQIPRKNKTFRRLETLVSGLVVFALATLLTIYFVKLPPPPNELDLASLSETDELREEAFELPSFERVMSFDEVMRLSPALRAEYLLNLQSVMVEIENPATLTSHDGDREPAQARSRSALPRERPYVTPENNVRCAHPLQAVRVAGIPSSSVITNYVCALSTTTNLRCPTGYVGVLQNTEGGHRCATSASFQALGASLRARLRTYNAHYQRVGRWTLGVFYRYGGDNAAFDASGPSAASFQRAIADEREQRRRCLANPRCAESLQEAARDHAARDAERSENRRHACQEEFRRTRRVSDFCRSIGYNPNDPPARRTPPRPQRQTAQPAPSSREQDIVVTAPRLVSRDVAACSPNANLPRTCTDQTVSSASARYKHDGNPLCINAGNFSSYRRSGGSLRCQAPNKFCFNDANCVSGRTPDFSCRSNEVICNPLLFGLKTDGRSPFCVARGQNVTRQCASASAAQPRAVHPLEATTGRPTTWQNVSGLREAWNDFARKMMNVCFEDALARTVHCRECHVIKKRLFAMNVAARSIRSCGAALRFEQTNCSSSGTCEPGSRLQPGSNERSTAR